MLLISKKNHQMELNKHKKMFCYGSRLLQWGKIEFNSSVDKKQKKLEILNAGV